MIEIKNLYAAINGKLILKALNLHVKAGEVHAIMGPNGAGKSTLSRVIAGDPSYEILEGEIWFEGKNILDLAPEERAHLGLFIGFQYPLEIAGITNLQFLHAVHNARSKSHEKPLLSDEEFSLLMDQKMAMMEMREEFKLRNLNEGFSGGEKKRNEILQMAVLEPKLAILDETDSGLDIDAMRVVAKGVNRLTHQNNALILITHYQRLLDYIRPHFVHIMKEGAIIRSGGPELALELEQKGYDGLISTDGEMI